MSFVNLMADDRWSEADIVRRTEALIASEFPPEAQAILNRKATGAALGAYTLTPQDQADLQHFTSVSLVAQQAGIEARAQMALLGRVLDAEQGIAPLAEDDADGLALLAERAAQRAPAEPTTDNTDE